MPNIDQLELIEAWSESDPSRSLRFTFPIFSQTGAAATTVVYFEIDPGKHLGTHRDSAEETLFLVSGRGEGVVGDQRTALESGDLMLIPAMVPHDVVNAGDEPLRVIGFFSAPTIVSVFDDPLAPIGKHVVGTPMPEERPIAAVA